MVSIILLPLTYFDLYLANGTSDKFDKIKWATLFVHFEILMPMETAILINALNKQIYRVLESSP